jgi:hypothetical protein
MDDDGDVDAGGSNQTGYDRSEEGRDNIICISYLWC